MLKKLLPHPNGGKPKMLPSPRFMSQENEQETILAREMLGVTVRPAKNGEAAVRSLHGDSVDRAIAYHQAPSFIDGSPLELQEALRSSSDLTFLIRAVEQSPEAFLEHVQSQKDLSKNDFRNFVLDETVEWALPKKNTRIFGHDLLIWGAKETIIPEGREQTAALYGKVVGYLHAGSVLRSVVYGLPMDMSETRRDPVTGAVDPVWYAAPRRIMWYPRYCLLPDLNKAFSFWSGVITSENIKQILNLGDLLLHAEVVEGYLYASALLRVATRIENGRIDFSVQAAQLAKLGKWEQRSGSDIRKAFQAFIPGSSPQPSWHRHSVSKPQQVLKDLTRPLRTIGDRDGTNMMGLVADQPLLLNPMLRPGRLYVGPSKTGKSTLAAAHAIQVTSNIVWLPLTAGQFEGAPYWVEQMGGTIIELNLPDAYALNANGAKSNRRLLEQKQEELHISDKQLAEAKMREIEEEWYRLDRITGLPLTFRVISGDSVRLLNFYTHFLSAWKDAWRRWYEKTGEWCLVVADNFSALQLPENDPILGDIPKDVGRNLGISIAWLVSNGRNIGTACWILTHSLEDLDYISTGLHPQIGLEISLKHDDYTMAEVLQPKEREVMVPKLYIRLPKPIKSQVERREPTQDGQPWLQKERSAGY